MKLWSENKQKDKKRMDFDETTNEIIENSVKRAHKVQKNRYQEDDLDQSKFLYSNFDFNWKIKYLKFYIKIVWYL